MGFPKELITCTSPHYIWNQKLCPNLDTEFLAKTHHGPRGPVYRCSVCCRGFSVVSEVTPLAPFDAFPTPSKIQEDAKLTYRVTKAASALSNLRCSVARRGAAAGSQHFNISNLHVNIRITRIHLLCTARLGAAWGVQLCNNIFMESARKPSNFEVRSHSRSLI